MDDHEQTGGADPVEDGEVGGAPEPVGAAPRSIIDGEEHPVDPRSVMVARIIGFVTTLLVAMLPLLIPTIGWAVGGIPSLVYLPLIGGLLVLVTSVLVIVYRWTAARHARLRYLVDDEGLRIRRGVFWRKVIWIPISRVQHTDYSQGPVQRRFELATLTVHTAGTAGASISLDGLEYGVARQLCHHLRPERETDAS